MESIKKIARENFILWNEALQTGDPKKVAELYSSEVSFLPTMSPEFKHGISETEEYFVHFLEKNPKGKIIEEKVQPLTKNIYLHSGLYDFELDGKKGRQTIAARFSYAWKKEAGGQWKIIHHHSSIKPE